MREGVELIAAERKRQIEKEGWSSEHDDSVNRKGELAKAAICYAAISYTWSEPEKLERIWPYDSEWFKPSATSSIRNLVKAGALIAAEIDRLQRTKPAGDGGYPDEPQSDKLQLREGAPVIFLDIDGVLNNHLQMENHYCGTKYECVQQFNRILDAIPEAKIVISSAWRYMILRGDVTLKGFEMLLLTHGVKCHERVIGHTVADGPIEQEPSHHDPEAWKESGLKWRREQIRQWAFEHNVTRYVAVDDLPLDMPEQVWIDGEQGMQHGDANAVIARLQYIAEVPPPVEPAAEPEQFVAGDWVSPTDDSSRWFRQIGRVVKVDHDTGHVSATFSREDCWFDPKTIRRATPKDVRLAWCRLMDWDDAMVAYSLTTDPPADMKEELEQLGAAQRIAEINKETIQQRVSLSKRGETVSIECECSEHADEVLGWLERLAHTSKETPLAVEGAKQ